MPPLCKAWPVAGMGSWCLLPGADYGAGETPGAGELSIAPGWDYAECGGANQCKGPQCCPGRSGWKDFRGGHM